MSEQVEPAGGAPSARPDGEIEHTNGAEDPPVTTNEPDDATGTQGGIEHTGDEGGEEDDEE